MKKQLQNAAIFLLTVVVFVLSFGTSQKAQAQPEGYCVPGEQGNYYYMCYASDDYIYYKYYFNPHIQHVKIYNSDEAPLTWEGYPPLWETGEGCYKFVDQAYVGDGLLFPGNTYTAEMKIQWTYYWYYSQPTPYCNYYWSSYYTNYYWASKRIFIDWAQDGSWAETNFQGTGVSDWINGNTVNEYRVSWATFPFWNGYTYYKDFCLANYTYTHQFTVPADVEVGKTRARFMASSYFYYYWHGYGATYYTGADPANACNTGYGYVYYWQTPSPVYYYDYSTTLDFIVEFGLPLESTFPSNEEPDNMLYAGELYNGTNRMKDGVLTTFKRPMMKLRSPQPAGTLARFIIRGPLPSTTELYVAHDENGSEYIDISGGINFPIMHSEINSYSPTGNGEFIAWSGGEYEVYVEMFKPGQNPATEIGKFAKYRFNVVWANDMAAVEIISPETSGAPRFTKYIRNLPIALTAVVQNTGLNPAYKFDVTAYIYDSDGSLMESRVHHYNVNDGVPPIAALAKYTVDFGIYSTDIVDIYTMVVEVDLLSAEDLEDFNDRYAREGDEPHTFTIADEIEAAVFQPLFPEENGMVNVSRPFQPAVVYSNNGISDISNAVATFIVKDGSNTVIKTGTAAVQEIPQGRYNKKVIYFDAIDIAQPGTYQMEYWIDANGDDPDIKGGDKANTEAGSRPDMRDGYIYSFSVSQGLAGTYKVGMGQNFISMGHAVDEIYKQGLNGSIVLELTDKLYDEGYGYNMMVGSGDPAIDFTTEIIGLGWDDINKRYNTITIKPSAERAVERGGVLVNLHTVSGKGFEFGQDITHISPNAAIKQKINNAYFKRFINNAGHIIIDGGQNKSLKFSLLDEGTNPFGTVFFLQRGSQNIQILNTLIENGTPRLATSTWLPSNTHNLNEGFKYQTEYVTTQSGDLGFSAGITNRATLLDRLYATYDEAGNLIPDTEDGEVLQLFLDTLTNSNNTFRNNEIRGFGYGIVSFGLGVLYKPDQQSYKPYYNTGTIIEDNIIQDVARAGIVLGFEDGAMVKNNVIQGVTGESNDFSGQFAGDAYGIILGTDGYNEFLAYNNLNVDITGNIINDLSADRTIKGISLTQVDNRYVDPNAGFYIYPGGNDNLNITSNAIWRIAAKTAATDRAGIHVYSERDRYIADKITRLLTPKYGDYYVEDVTVANNTIMIAEDGINNDGMTVGIGFQQVKNAVNKNNAIAITDGGITGEINTLLLLQGARPNEGSLTSDYNAYYRGNSGADIVRYVESYGIFNDVANTTQTIITHEGFQGEYKDLVQWQMWTGADYNSIAGTDFTGDYIEVGSNPRGINVKSPAPYSVLNNRGERLAEVVYDVNGRTKGAADERYDIGAVEFDGKMYRRDLEAMLITAPGVYRATAPATFDDAEYIMTAPETNFSARIRNNSSTQISEVPVKLEITSASIPGYVFSDVVYTQITSTNTVEIDFEKIFEPKSFAQLSMNVDRAIFTGMEHNVTPVYNIKISVDYDENNVNNILERQQRFFIQRSPMQLAVSNSSYEPATVNTPDELAVLLNSSAIYTAFKDMGWKYEVAWNNASITEDRYDYDIFNRAGWYDRTVDYSIFRTIMWTDGNDKPMTRNERISLYSFLNDANNDNKKNMVIGSQEIVELNANSDPDFDFVVDGLRAVARYPYSPLMNDSYAGHNVIGANIARGVEFSIQSTGVLNDAEPYPALLSAVEEGDGTAKAAFLYADVKNPNSGMIDPDRMDQDRIMGIALTSLYKNVVTLGADWRHFGDPESIIRSSFDFIESNGGLVIPVELLDFTAEQNGSRVDLNWSTASETNSSLFEVEKAEIADGIRSSFAKIGEVPAAVNSAVTSYYNTSDKTIESGATYSYRLKMIDMDGEFEYSGERVLTIDADGSISLDGVTPNPVNSVSVLRYTLGTSTDVRVELYDVSGKLVMTLANSYQTSGTHELNINAGDLSSGVYKVVLHANGKTLSTNVNIVK